MERQHSIRGYPSTTHAAGGVAPLFSQNVDSEECDGGQMNRLEFQWQNTMEGEIFVECITGRGYDGTFQTTAFKP